MASGGPRERRGLRPCHSALGSGPLSAGAAPSHGPRHGGEHPLCAGGLHRFGLRTPRRGLCAGRRGPVVEAGGAIAGSAGGHGRGRAGRQALRRGWRGDRGVGERALRVRHRGRPLGRPADGADAPGPPRRRRTTHTASCTWPGAGSKPCRRTWRRSRSTIRRPTPRAQDRKCPLPAAESPAPPSTGSSSWRAGNVQARPMPRSKPSIRRRGGG